MASFTDEIHHFSPYIKQLPVQEMANAEMYRQNQYDQGVAAIDQTFNNIANLPIDSKYSNYAQSALSKLQEGVKKVAGSDFSNSQLVNQIENAGRQIASDPIIQNGVVSAQVDKQNRDQMQDDRKNGKLMPENLSDYQNQYAKWKQNPDLSMPFNGEYTQGYDWRAPIRDALKSVGDFDNTTIDNFIQTDRNGKPVLGSDGKPVLNPATIERTIKGKSVEQVKNIIYGTLDEKALNQIRIEADYHMRGYTPEQLTTEVNNKYSSSLQDLQDRKKNLLVLKAEYPDDATYQAKIEEQIKQLDDASGKIPAMQKQALSLISSDPDQVKRSLYLNQTIDQLSSSYSNASEVDKLVKNPYLEQQNWQATYDQAAQRMQWEHDYQMEDLRIKRETADAKSNPLGPSLLNGEKLASPQDPNIKQASIDSFNKGLADNQAQIDQNKGDFFSKYYPNLSKPDADVQYAKWKQDWDNGVKLNPDIQAFMDEQYQAEKSLKNGQALVIDITNKADERFKQQEASVANIVKPVAINGFVYNQDALLSFIDKVQTSSTDRDKPSFIQKYGKNYNPLDHLTPAETNLYNAYNNSIQTRQFIDNIKTTIPSQVRQVSADKAAWMNDQLSSRVGKYIPETSSFNIINGEKGNRQAITNALANLNTVAVQNKGTVVGNPDFDAGQWTQLLNDNNYTVGFSRTGDKAVLTLTGTIGSKKTPVSQTMTLDRTQFLKSFKTDFVSPYQDAADAINMSGGISTNIIAKNPLNDPNNTAYKTAYYQKLSGSQYNSFPNVSKYNVKADIMTLQNGTYQAIYYIKSPGSNSWKTVVGTQFSDINPIIESFSSPAFNDDQLDRYLTNNK